PHTTADKINTTVAKSCNGPRKPKKMSANVLAPAESPEVRVPGSYDDARATAVVNLVPKYAANKPTQKRSATVWSAKNCLNEIFADSDIFLTPFPKKFIAFSTKEKPQIPLHLENKVSEIVALYKPFKLSAELMTNLLYL